jgi:hypothetical protein
LRETGVGGWGAADACFFAQCGECGGHENNEKQGTTKDAFTNDKNRIGGFVFCGWMCIRG